MPTDERSPGVPQTNDTDDRPKRTEPAVRNPWDDDKPDTETPADPDRELTMRLLRPSLIALAACTGVIFLSAVASNNAVANSPLERASLAIHRLGMFGLLVSFFGILISYRLPFILRILQSDSSQPGEHVLKNNRFPSGVRSFLLANAVLVGMIWVVAYLGGPWLMSMLQHASLIAAGVLCSITLNQRGYLQAYSIGSLVPLLIISLQWQTLVMQASYTYGFSSPQDQWLISSTIALHLSGAVVSGLISAVVYAVLRKKKAADEDRQ